jgi:hypothetical protein
MEFLSRTYESEGRGWKVIDLRQTESPPAVNKEGFLSEQQVKYVD